MTYADKNLKLQAKQVNFLILQQYLTGRSWTKYPSKKGDKVFFRKEDNNNLSEIIIPLTRDFSDYEDAILNAIKLIAKYEQRDPIQLINDLLYQHSKVYERNQNENIL